MKRGRPKLTEKRDQLVHVGFKADQETVEAIGKLVAAATGPGVRSPKSAAIRRALIEAAERISGDRKNG